MNRKRLTKLHGTRPRLQIENKLGSKMVKLIAAIEFGDDSVL